jgi:hypothetical protein
MSPFSRHALAGLLALGTLSGTAAAHNLGTTVTLITLGDNAFEMRLECDLDALVLGAGPGADDAELARTVAAMAPAELEGALEDLERLFLRRVRLYQDNEALEFEVDFPDRGDGVTLAMVPPTFLGLTARLRGTLPAGPRDLRLRLSRAFPDAEITVVGAAGEVLLEERVPRGEDSSVFPAGDTVPTPGSGDEIVAPAWFRLLVALLLLGALARGLQRSRRNAP